MFFKNDYDVCAYDYANNECEVSVRLTGKAKTKLAALLQIKEKIESEIFKTRMYEYEKNSTAEQSDEQSAATVEDTPSAENNTLRQFHIYHATGPDAFTPVEAQPREYTGFVNAKNLAEAFRLAQHGSTEWVVYGDARSTCVGDVIQDNDKFYMVTGSGFELLLSEEDRKNECELNGFENNYDME